MARVDSNLASILTAIVGRLHTEIDELDDSNCYLSLDPDEVPTASNSDICCVVSPANGTFDDSLWDGGGREQLTSDTAVMVKIHSTLQLDQAGRFVTFLTDKTRGVCQKMLEVLDALAGYDVSDGTDELVRHPLIPASFAFDHDGRRIGGVEIVFNVKFDWALT